MSIKSQFYLGSLLAGMLWLPGALWAACELNSDSTKAVSVYSLSGQGNFSCRDLTMDPAVGAAPVAAVPPDPFTFAWEVEPDSEFGVDSVVVEDSSGKRCVYNYGPGATDGSGLKPPTTKPIADYLICADKFNQPAPNTPPVVTITYFTDPFDPTIGIPGGQEIEFVGTAADEEEGDLSFRLEWSSSLDGPLGMGSSVTVSDLSAGDHQITAQVTDEDGEGLVGTASVSLTIIAIVVQQCEAVVDVDGQQVGVLINGVEVTCPTGDEPRLVCSADLGGNADKFEIDSTACCVCNATATECDPELAELPEGEEPVGGLPACPKTKDGIGGLQVPTTLMLNNDPYYCYTVGGRRTCFAY